MNVPGILSHVTRFAKPMGVQRAEAATPTIRRAHLTLSNGGEYRPRPTLRATLHPKTHPKTRTTLHPTNHTA